MSGKIKGVQSLLLEKNDSALYSPCAAHSLNLIGVNAAKMCPKVVTYFGYVQQLYVFFSSSPARWSILKDEIGNSLHSQSNTRWSSRIHAIRPISKQLPSIINALDRVINELGKTLPEKNHSEVKSMKKYFTTFKSLIMSSFWYKILSCIDQRNVIIQKRGISLDVEINLLSDLKKDLQNIRDSWPQILLETQQVAKEMQIVQHFGDNTRRIKRKKKFIDETSENTEPEMVFRNDVIYYTIDFILSDLEHRFQAVKNICNIFEPLLNFLSLTNEELELKTKSLVQKYKYDLSENMCQEMLHLKTIYSSTFQKSHVMPPLELLNSIYAKNVQTIFVNVCISLRIFCTIPVTVAEAERSFSNLGNSLKTWQRSTTSQERLNSLAILSMENELASTINFDDIITEFAELKARRIKF
ncbi:uncharacterized protein LOC112592770 [Melanaphis sacchari]|uniref:uncharacterized protein LOC112592770 n=1 Tax=Melanaphis sacchari TaxID=742174 RepID=UPI000DC14221|nr:uncharacterized protein LOC112592770 [Melanaphis sacchari]